MNAKLESREDPWEKLAALWRQAALLRTNAIELEQLGLTLSGRDVSTVDHADLVSYAVWISQFTSQTALVLANWGFGLIGYLDSSLRSAGLTPPASTPATAASPPGARRAGRSRRRRGQS